MHIDIHILAACTDRKRAHVPKRLRLRSIAKGDASSVAKAWGERLKNDGTEAVVAENSYSGDHWANACQLATMASQQGLTTKSFVISAGHGLVSVTSQIRPYSVTFASSSPDSVIRRMSKNESRKVVLQTWWKEICAMGNASVNKPRSISALARRTPSSTFIVIASPNYLLALEEDLLGAMNILPDKNQLIIISSNSSFLSPLIQDHIVPSIEPLQSVVGGALGALHARVASLIIKNAHRWNLRADGLRKRLKKLATPSRPVRKYHRKRLTDVEVCKFVRQGLRRSSRKSCSTLLQELRASGFACEQQRFRDLFWSVREKKHAS